MRRLLSFLVALVLIETIDTAQAQPSTTALQPASSTARVRARHLRDHGNRMMRKRRFQEALAAFEQAYDVFPSPKLFASIGRAHFLLGSLADAANFYQRYLDSDDRAPRRSAAAAAALRKLDARLGRLAVTFHAPPDATVELRVGPGDWMPSIAWLRVEAGDFEVQARIVGETGEQTQSGRVEADNVELVFFDFTVPDDVADERRAGPEATIDPRPDPEPAMVAVPVAPPSLHPTTATPPPQISEDRPPRPASAGDAKSPSVAVALSLVGTLTAGAFLAKELDNEDPPILSGIGLVIAPSFGHYYADDVWTGGMLMRLASALSAGVGAALLDDDRESDVGTALLAVGSVGAISGAFWDISTAPAAARRWNERHLSISPVAFGSAAGIRPGIGISARW